MKLTYLGDFEFVGDLSLQDADVLAKYARKSKSILEFGVGGSTQIFAQALPDCLLSLETNPEWVSLTQEKLAMIETKTDPIFCDSESIGTHIQDKVFNLIFVDGVGELRLEFAMQTWNFLAPGGFMIFHDTRQQGDFVNLCNVAATNFTEIKRIDVNEPASNGVSSNTSIIHKKVKEEYVNWNYVENKPLWAYGAEPMPKVARLWRQ
jgi:hypothetical protein